MKTLKSELKKQSSLTLWTGADEALTFKGVVEKDGRNIQEKDLGVLKKPWILTDKNKIVFVGTKTQFDSYYSKNKKDLKNIKEKKIVGTVLPGYVESHTHLVFAGDRRHEFELRNKGVSYQEIATKGGGIKYTCEQTEKASKETLKRLAQQRVDEFKKQGVVLLESKSGYGSDLKTELKILEVSSELKNMEIVSTFLGLHSIHPVRNNSSRSANSKSRDLGSSSKAQYVHEVLDHYFPMIHKKTNVRHADIFLDQGYFDKEDLNSLVNKVKSLGWTFTAHTDQLSSTGLGLKAAQLGALSISHCVNMTDEEIEGVAKTNTVFNLLPAADFYLKIKYPKARKMLESEGKVSLATDFNPGSSPTQNLNFVGVLARLEMKMTLPEVLVAYTYNAASGLGLQKKYGALGTGFTSNFQVIAKSWDELFYQI